MSSIGTPCWFPTAKSGESGLSLCNMLLESNIPMPLSWYMNHADAGIEAMIGFRAPVFGLLTFYSRRIDGHPT